MANSPSIDPVTGTTIPMPPAYSRDQPDAGYWNDKHGPGPRVMAADTLEGDTVRNDADEKLGELIHIMIDVPTGRVAYGVLSVGGFLGIGDKLFDPVEGVTAGHREPRLSLECFQGKARGSRRIRSGRLAVDGRPAVGGARPLVLRG